MVGQLSFGLGALLLATVGISCTSEITFPPSGSSSSGGVGGAGGSGGSALDAGPDVIDAGPPGPCVMAADCVAQSDTCNLGTCVNGTCVKMPFNEFASCDDGQFCTENDVCQSGQCVGGKQKSCPAPGSSCQVGVCDEALKACSSTAGNDGSPCDDKNSCTGTGVCSAGTCSAGQPIDCSSLDGPCSVGVCDPETGCNSVPGNEGGFCDDGQNNPCITGKCGQGACNSVAANEGGSCDDKLFCTIGDHCHNAVCVGGGPKPCAPPGGCYIASCNELNDTCTAVPGNNGAACDDSNVCTKSTTCLNGSCTNGLATNNGAMCDDGSTCTSATTCSAGVCGGGVGPTVYFADDFHDSSKGWLLGPEWQIGSAKASQDGQLGADPSEDHTPTADNGVAGVVLGGNEEVIIHPYYYLESPPFNTAGATGKVVLGFQRWLNSDYDPYMHNRVEVYTGSQWLVLWESGSAPGIQDSPPEGPGWTFQQFDITSYKNAAMKVRFGFDVQKNDAFSVGSWNLDDVLVSNAACP